MSARQINSLFAIVLAAWTASGCLRASAKTVVDVPPLDMPPPPPRVVETVEASAPAPLPLVEEPPRQPVVVPPRPAPPRAEAARPPEAKPEPPPAEAPKTAEEPAKPPTPLQTTPAAEEVEVERTIRGVLTKAATDLNRVNFRALNAEARNQYDTAKRFMQQADMELRTTRNLVFAQNLADKAAALAAQLAGR
jgi:outer membrane biosynthesis protein TonB